MGFDAEAAPIETIQNIMSPKSKKKPKESAGSIDINCYGPPPIPSNT